MTENKLIDDIKDIIDIDPSELPEEDRVILEKIKALVEAGDEQLDAIADRIEAEEETAVAEETVVEEETPVVEETVVEEETPVAEETPAAEETVAEEETSVEKEYGPLPVPPTGEHKASLASRIEKRFSSANPKTGLGRFLTKNRHNAVLAATILLAVMTGGWQLADYLIPQDITVEIQTLEGSEEVKVSTRCNTVAAAIEDSGLDVTEDDYVYPIADHPIKSGDSILVKKSVPVSAEIAGEKQDFLLIPGTVQQNLEFNNVAFDDDDIVTPARDAEVSLKSKIVMKEVHFTVEEKKEKEPAKSVVMLDPSLYSGKVVTQKGHDGEGIFTYTTTYVNGKKTKTVREVKKWIDEPVDNALRLGTSLTGHKGTYKVKRTFTANTTAYYMGEHAYGAAGGHCVYGTCAVDPKVIPYGTMLFVEGYGVAIANDCGGAIKGDKLDLWMHSYNESCRWGRRYVKTYVLGK